MEEDKLIKHFVSRYCNGEKCRMCHKDASHKVEETIFDDDPTTQIYAGIEIVRHPYTAYVCCKCFEMIMGGGVSCE